MSRKELEKTIQERSFRTGPTGPYIDPEISDDTIVDVDSELVPIVVDLSSHRRGNLDESFLSMFGSSVRTIMDRMFGGPRVPVTIRGTPSEVKSFSNVLGKEKGYMQAYRDFGLDDPRTYKSKYKLDGAIRQFERKTGLIWPFK